MVELSELLLTSDVSSNLGSACVWDYKTGSCVHNFKSGGILSSHTLCFISDSYFIAAERSKPLIHVWQINSQETVKNSKIICSGPVSALAVSPEGNYCAAGIGEQLYVWQVATGRLLSVVSRHFQPIVHIKLTSDSSFLVTAGEDGLVLVWEFSRLVSQMLLNSQIEPLHVLSEHSLPVRDMHVSAGTTDVRIATVSDDCMLNIHQLLSGELLLSVVFEESLTAVTALASGTSIFVGTSTGNIHEFSLLNPPRSKVFHKDCSLDKASVFCGHTKSISALSVSADGLTLASGSTDGQVILWHISTKQKLRVIPHSGSVSNLQFFAVMDSMFAETFKPNIIFNNFQRTLASDDQIQCSVQVIHRRDIRLPFSEMLGNNVITSDCVKTQDASYFQAKIDKLKLINSQLYQFSIDRILEIKHSKHSLVDGADMEALKSQLVYNEHSKTGQNVKPNKKKRKHL